MIVARATALLFGDAVRSARNGCAVYQRVAENVNGLRCHLVGVVTAVAILSD